MLVIRDGAEEIRKEDERNIPRFLNRILALEIEEQNALFDYFSELFDQTVRYAKASGTYDEGVADIRALAIRLSKPAVVIHRDRVTGAETVLYVLEVDKPSEPVSFERAERVRLSSGGNFVRHREKGEYALVRVSGRQTDPADGTTFQTYSVWKPEAARTAYIREMELNEKYQPVLPNQVEHWWQQRHAAAPTVDTSEVHTVAGSIIPLWDRLKTNSDSKLRVVRVSTRDGQRIVGVEIPRLGVAKVLKSLGLRRSPTDPDKIFTEVLENGDEIRLVSDLALKRSTLRGSPAIELVCTDSDRFDGLRKLKLINEQIKFRQRFFVPTDRRKGIPILKALLERYPVMPEKETGELLPLVDRPSATEHAVIDLVKWVLPPETVESEPLGFVPEIPMMAAPAATVEEDLTPLLPELFSPDQHGPTLASLVEERTRLSTGRHRRKPRPAIEEQGLLFGFQ